MTIQTKTPEIFRSEDTHSGIYSDLTMKEYNDAHGVRRSNMTALMTSAKFYKWRQSHPMKGSDALTFGSAFHTAVLEPDKWEDEIVVGPSVGKRTKKWTEFKEYNSDKIILHPDDMDVIQAMLKSFHGHRLSMSLLEGKPVEESAWSVIDGQSVKARCDIADYERGMLIDVKTTQDASFNDFQRSTYKYKYDVQAAYYLDTFNSAILGKDYATATKMPFTKFVFIAIEKNPPHDIQVYVGDPTLIDSGRRKYKDALELLTHSQETNEWNGYEEQIINLTLPKWAQ